jgi:tRNA(fMet)-specific endonuclease VapC
MIILDTDHLSVLRFEDGERFARLMSRLEASTDNFVSVTIVSIEEQMRGWLATINKERLAIRQVRAYRELSELFNFFNCYHIVAFDERAAEQFDQLRRVRIGTMDRKIAAIANVNNALLLTANRRDFEQIPGLRFENWMDEPPASTNRD